MWCFGANAVVCRTLMADVFILVSCLVSMARSSATYARALFGPYRALEFNRDCTHTHVLFHLERQSYTVRHDLIPFFLLLFRLSLLYFGDLFILFVQSGTRSAFCVRHLAFLSDAIETIDQFNHLTSTEPKTNDYRLTNRVCNNNSTAANQQWGW